MLSAKFGQMKREGDGKEPALQASGVPVGSGRPPTLEIESRPDLSGLEGSLPSPWALDQLTSGSLLHRRPCGRREVGSPQPSRSGGDGEDVMGAGEEVW
jgi:hypothetical protein